MAAMIFLPHAAPCRGERHANTIEFAVASGTLKRLESSRPAADSTGDGTRSVSMLAD